MRTLSLLALFAGAAFADEKPAVGKPAPELTLNAQDGKPVALKELRGKWVVLYFYPKDFTSGCSLEAHNFARDQAEYDKKNAVILGVSTQDAESHQKFCVKEGVHFKLLADTKNEVSQKYDSLMSVIHLSQRHTFLIDPSGVVRKIYLDVHPANHSDEVLADLTALQK